jgi:hypothetical protein
LLLAVLLTAVASCVPPDAEAQAEQHCREAHRFLVEEVGMTAVSEPDTIDDWRTDQMVPGCRVTAAGLTENTMRTEATLFYERVREAGWVRTPDPQDAPNEASLRFRKDGSDCLFNFYTGGILGTEAEAIVDEAVVPVRGQSRYNFLVLCMPEMPAAPRG